MNKLRILISSEMIESAHTDIPIYWLKKRFNFVVSNKHSKNFCLLESQVEDSNHLKRSILSEFCVMNL